MSLKLSEFQLRPYVRFVEFIENSKGSIIPYDKFLQSRTKPISNEVIHCYMEQLKTGEFSKRVFQAVVTLEPKILSDPLASRELAGDVYENWKHLSQVAIADCKTKSWMTLLKILIDQYDKQLTLMKSENSWKVEYYKEKMVVEQQASLKPNEPHEACVIAKSMLHHAQQAFEICQSSSRGINELTNSLNKAIELKESLEAELKHANEARTKNDCMKSAYELGYTSYGLGTLKVPESSPANAEQKAWKEALGGELLIPGELDRILPTVNSFNPLKIMFIAHGKGQFHLGFIAPLMKIKSLRDSGVPVKGTILVSDI